MGAVSSSAALVVLAGRSDRMSKTWRDRACLQLVLARS
jgi:hypothetical protein